MLFLFRILIEFVCCEKTYFFEALREVYPTITTGSFISKPVQMDELVRRINSELE
jgi:hypothetical protein